MFVGPQLFPSLVLWEEKKMHKWQRLRTNGESLRSCGVWQKEHRNHGVPARGWWNGATESRPMEWKGEEPLLLCFQLEARESILKEFGAASQKSKPRLIKTSAAEFPLLLSAVPNASENISQFQLFGTHLIILSTCVFFLSYSVFTFIWFYAGAKSLMFSPQTAHSRFSFFPPEIVKLL